MHKIGDKVIATVVGTITEIRQSGTEEIRYTVTDKKRTHVIALVLEDNVKKNEEEY